jgi:hypothetical protein
MAKTDGDSKRREREAREARRARALRANLERRKAQARARAEAKGDKGGRDKP